MFEGFVSHALWPVSEPNPLPENTHQVPTQKTSGHLMRHSNPRQEALSVRLRLVCANVYGFRWSGILLAMMECAALSSHSVRQSW